MKYTDRRLPMNCRLCPAKCLMKRRLGYRASGHYPRPALHRCLPGQNQHNADVAPDDPCPHSFLLTTEDSRGSSWGSTYISLVSR
ncbi:hypothetical protein HAX54_000785, partial [Datura stramonium]|nr:hypothetical protein [Datura stramonium]